MIRRVLLSTVVLPLATTMAQERIEQQIRSAPPTDVVVRSTVVHDVRDLINSVGPEPQVVTDKPADDLPSSRSSRGMPTLQSMFEREIARDVAVYEAELRQRRLRELELHEIVRMWKTFARPSFGAGDRIEIIGQRQVALHATAAHHQWLAELLLAKRNAGSAEPQIDLSFTIVSGPNESFTKAGLVSAATYASESEFEAMRARLKDDRLQILHAPRVRCIDMRQARVSMTSSMSYISDYRSHIHFVGMKRQAIAEPVIEVVQEGIELRTRAMLLPSGEIGLLLEFENTELKRPVRTRKVRLASGIEQEVEVSDPEIVRSRFSTDVLLSDGASASFLSPRRGDEDLLVMVTARIVR